MLRLSLIPRSSPAARGPAPYDFVIVGSGAGSVVARRLAERKQRVLLLEAGPSNKPSFRSGAGGGPFATLLHVPLPSLAYAVSFSKKFNWQFLSEEEPFLEGRRIFQPRGRVLGGSSTINGMIYVRGNPRDYGLWEELCGDSSVGYEALLPYFRKSETFEQLTCSTGTFSGNGDTSSTLFSHEFHGTTGPLRVSRGRFSHEISDALIGAACDVTGLPRREDFCTRDIDGFGFYHLNQFDGLRWSAADGYLDPRFGDDGAGTSTSIIASHLTVRCDASVDRVLFDDANRAVGVRVRSTTDPSKPAEEVFVEKEVVLSAGVFQTPQILMLSGIGNASDLQRVGGEKVRVNSVGVGRNLLDHLDVFVQHENPSGEALGLTPRGMARATGHALRYVRDCAKKSASSSAVENSGAGESLFDDNVLMSNGVDSGGFMQAHPNSGWTDVQYHFFPGSFRDYSLKGLAGHNFATNVYLSRPRSAGRVYLPTAVADNDALDTAKTRPQMVFNFLKDQHDVEVLTNAIKRARDMMRHPLLDRYRGKELSPGEEAWLTDKDLVRHLRAHCKSAHHPVGTCRMGREEEFMASESSSDSHSEEAMTFASAAPPVVSPEFEVFGCENLRVVDASVFPTHIASNPWGTIVALAEKSADDIGRRWALAGA